MKVLKFLVACTLMSLPFSALAKEVSVTVKGMVCGFCAQGIEKKLKALPEVAAVDVSLEKKIVKISTKENKDITDATINGILKEAGYNVEKIERGDKL
jgi:mercuric ion binding protein